MAKPNDKLQRAMLQDWLPEDRPRLDLAREDYINTVRKVNLREQSGAHITEVQMRERQI